MVQITYTAIFLLALITRVTTICLFIPDDSLACVDTWISPDHDMENECTNTYEPFIFTGVTHIKEGDTLIGVRRINKLRVNI